MLSAWDTVTLQASANAPAINEIAFIGNVKDEPSHRPPGSRLISMMSQSHPPPARPDLVFS
jgi:hypothetical protein